jgi:hypothetical protein
LAKPDLPHSDNDDPANASNIKQFSTDQQDQAARFSGDRIANPHWPWLSCNRTRGARRAVATTWRRPPNIKQSMTPHRAAGPALLAACRNLPQVRAGLRDGQVQRVVFCCFGPVMARLYRDRLAASA